METQDGVDRRPPLGALAIVAYCAFQSGHLVAAWRHSPFDRWSWIALLIWLVPVAFVWIRTPEEFQPVAVNHWVCGAALLVSLGGTMAAMNAIKYLGLAIAVVGLIHWRAASLIWLAGAAAWMPAFGYFLAKAIRLGPPADLGLVLASRVVVATGVVGCLWKLRTRQSRR